MTELKPLNIKNFVRFDVDAFIREFKNFEAYFREQVKLINEVSLKQKDDCFIFILDTPSTDIELELGIDKDYRYDPPKTCYYLKFDMSPYKIRYLSISKKQYESVLKICRGISENAKEREEEFNRARIEVLTNLFRLAKEQRKYIMKSGEKMKSE